MLHCSGSDPGQKKRTGSGFHKACKILSQVLNLQVFGHGLQLPRLRRLKRGHCDNDAGGLSVSQRTGCQIKGRPRPDATPGGANRHQFQQSHSHGAGCLLDRYFQGLQ